MPTTPAIEAVDLVKRFGSTVAVDGVSFSVPPGAVLGLLGPNGAGKTTTVRMMTTLTEPTSGTARVAGFDVRREPEKVRRNMGLTGQVATVDELLTGRENIRMIGGLYGIRRKELARLGDGNGGAAPASAQLPLHHRVLATILRSLALTAIFAPFALRAYARRTAD